MDCRRHGSADSQHCVWRFARHGRGPAADRGGFRYPACRAFLLTQDEIGLYAVSAVFGLALGGLIPGYILGFARSSRLPRWIRGVMFAGALGMAGGDWLAGVIQGTGIAFNIVNPLLIRRVSAPACHAEGERISRLP